MFRKPTTTSEAVAQVQNQQKLLPYTVSVIGTGPEALAKWKAERKAIEYAYNTRMEPVRQATIQRAMTGVANQDCTLTFTEAETLEIQHQQARKKGPLTHIDPYEGTELSFISHLTEYEQAQKPTFAQRLKSLALSIWRNAFDGPTSK